MVRNCHQTFAVRKSVLRNFAEFTGKHLCHPQACNFIKKETRAQVFSYEFYEISKNTFSYRTLLVAASKTIHQKPRFQKSFIQFCFSLNKNVYILKHSFFQLIKILSDSINFLRYQQSPYSKLLLAVLFSNLNNSELRFSDYSIKFLSR